MEGRTSDQQDLLVDDLETEFGITFEDLEDDGNYHTEGVRWSSMTDDMKDFSTRYPDVTFRIRYEWPHDETEYVEWFRDGKTYQVSRPPWEPPAFDTTKLT